MRLKIYSILAGMILSASLAFAQQPIPVIFDTDMGNDIDDALALSMLHSLESRKESKLLAVTLTKDNPKAVPFIEIINNFYGRKNIPIGMIRDGKTKEDSKFLDAVVDQKLPNGKLAYPRTGKSEEAISLLRRVLAQAQDESVVMIQVGFSTNLARLLDSQPDKYSPLNGTDLVRKKCRLMSIMAGQFPPLKDKNSEYNVRIDVPSAQKLYANWPTPIVFSGFEIGLAMKFPATRIESDFAYVAKNPIVEAYRAYLKMPYDRPTWDLTSVLYAVRPNHGYFSLSPEGQVTVDDAGHTTFAAQAGGKHRHLLIDEQQKAKSLEAMIQLSSEPPR